MNEELLDDSFDAEQSISMPNMQELHVSYTAVPSNRDPIDALSDDLGSINSFIVSLQALDHPLTSGSLTSPIYPGLEASFQSHLQRLIESDRVREEQCRQLDSLAWDMGSLIWNGVELDLGLDRGLCFGIFGLVDEIEAERAFWGIGWAGLSEPNAMDLNQQLDPDTSLASFKSKMSTTATLASSPLAPLRQATFDITTTTHALITSLSALTEPLECTSSFSSASTRQLRGIRAGVDSWQERDAQDARSRRQVEEWESRRVQLGLRGLALKDVLSREVREFEGVLDDWRRKMRTLRIEDVTRGQATRIEI